MLRANIQHRCQMRRPTVLVIGGCVALVPRATPARPRTRLQASLDSFLADRSFTTVRPWTARSTLRRSVPRGHPGRPEEDQALVDYMPELMKKSMMADYTDEAAARSAMNSTTSSKGRKMLAIFSSLWGSDECGLETVWPASAI